MESFHLKLDEIPREAPFWLQVGHIGYSPASLHFSKVHHPTVNFSFTLSSKSARAVEVIDGVKRTKTIPCFGISAPGPLYESLTPQPVESLYLSYNAKYLEAIKRYNFDLYSGGFPIEISKTIAALLKELFARCAEIHTPGNMDRVDRICERLLTEAALSRNRETKLLSKNENAVRNIASFLEFNYSETCEWGVIARKHGLSKRTFLREWQKVFELPPGQYVARLKINEAKRLLMETPLKIREIAEILNFADPLYFSRKFKQHTGDSPDNFRKTGAGQRHNSA